MDAAGLGLCMISACLFAMLLGHPASPVPALIDNPLVQTPVHGPGDGVNSGGHYLFTVAQFAGALVAIYIAVEAPFSGMSLNPARTFGLALVSRLWTSLRIYFVAPPLGMLAAAEPVGLVCES